MDAAVRVMHQAGFELTSSQGHAQSRQWQFGQQMPIERPANDPATESVEDDSQVNKLSRQSNISNVGYPELVNGGQHQPPSQIRKDRQ